MLRGVGRLRFKFTLTMAAYDLVRLPKLLAAAARSGEHVQIRRQRHDGPHVVCNDRSAQAVSANFSGLLEDAAAHGTNGLEKTYDSQIATRLRPCGAALTFCCPRYGQHHDGEGHIRLRAPSQFRRGIYWRKP
jgi:hypothetical protein